MIYSMVDCDTGEVLCQANDFSFICHVAIAHKYLDIIGEVI